MAGTAVTLDGSLWHIRRAADGVTAPNSSKPAAIQLAQVNVSEIDRIQIDRGLAFIGDIDMRIKQSEATIRAMTKANANVKLLKTIPGIGEFFASLPAAWCKKSPRGHEAARIDIQTDATLANKASTP
ncbi:hypothetical protein HNR29_006386 [Rhizobium leguminosarum]|nr:hypothetical protein [Rhizobium leguminosarum]